MPTRNKSGRKLTSTLKNDVPRDTPLTETLCCSRSAASVLSFNAVGMRDSYAVLLLSLRFPVTLPPVSMVALFTWPVSTFAFQSLNDNDFGVFDDVGSK